MSRRILITFSGACYNETTQKIVERGPKMGADAVWVYDDRWLMRHEFYRQNAWLWDFPQGIAHPHPKACRGFGWFAWKPLVIMDALSRLKAGDMVMYVDADTYPIADFSKLYEICSYEGMMLFAAQGQPGEHWVKRDCLIVMGQDEDRYRKAPAAVARFMLFEKGTWKVQQFLMEWLVYCVNPSAQSFNDSTILPEYPELHEHRTEQAIFTLLAHKYGQHLYREACGFGNGALRDGVDGDLYPQLFEQVGQCGDRADLSGSRFRMSNVPGT